MNKNLAFESPNPSVAWILGAGALPSHIDPAHLALVWGSEYRTYANLRRRALSLAHALQKLGARPGDRVGAHLLNRGETFELYFACAYAGLTLVPISWRLVEREAAAVLADCQPVIVFSEPSIAHALVGPAAQSGTRLVMLEDDASGGAYESMAAGPGIPVLSTADPHLLLYTSGTTGTPKGVMLTHNNILTYSYQQVSLYRALDDRAVTLTVSPTFNTAGINELSLPTLLIGGTVVILPSRGWTPEKMAAHVHRHDVTHTTIYPSMMEPFLAADSQQTLALRSLRFVLTGGENVPPAVLSRFRIRWPQISVLIGYGSTESGSPTAIGGSDLDRRPGSVGRITMGSAIRIQDEHGNVVAPGTTGEVWAAGGAITKGYWNAPKLTASVLRDGWLNTGDLGYLDDEGYLYLQGRSRDVVISKGQNIYPAEVENVLLGHPDVEHAAVVGVPDAESGEAVCAVVVLRRGASTSSDEIVEFTRSRLASYKKPRHVLVAGTLPRNAMNKVIKKEVVKFAADQLHL